MIFGLVTGTVTSTLKHPSYEGRKLLVVAPLDERCQRRGEEFLAVDHVQAGVGDRVLVLREGNGVRQILGETGNLFPVLELIVGIVDQIDIPEAAYR